jgi:hypothetical protein
VQTLKVGRIARYGWPLVITAALVITAVFSLPPLVNIAPHDDGARIPTGVAGLNAGASRAATLRTSLAYELVAPISNVLDALTLLSPAQYAATFALCGVTFIILWTRRRTGVRGRVAARMFARAALGFMGGTVAVAGMMLVATRPMASLTLGDRDLIAIDFHSHTEASHDGRAGFNAERNREWHSSSGFDAAYVTDHRTFDGALAGAARNPSRSGYGTVLLPGVELRDGDEHPILIGVDPKRMRITSPDWKAAAVAADGGPAPPMLLLSLPGDFLRIPLDETGGAVRVAGIEAADGSPRGMAQAARDRDAIVALAGTLHLALVSASDNHGWGRTAPAWSVMSVPGWRDMTPAQLDIAIRRTIVAEGSRAIDVIARRTAPPPRNVFETAAGGIMVADVMMRTMSLSDRLSWLAWSWGLCFLSPRLARRNGNALGSRGRKRADKKLAPDIDAAA